jgi:hypothetical protein
MKRGRGKNPPEELSSYEICRFSVTLIVSRNPSNLSDAYHYPTQALSQGEERERESSSKLCRNLSRHKQV